MCAHLGAGGFRNAGVSASLATTRGMALEMEWMSDVEAQRELEVEPEMLERAIELRAVRAVRLRDLRLLWKDDVRKFQEVLERSRREDDAA